MNTFSVLLIAAILAMASSAPNNKEEKLIKFADSDQERWQSVGEMKYNFPNEYIEMITLPIFDLFPYQTDDLLRMQELVGILDTNEILTAMCPPGNHWSMFGFKLCGNDHVLGNPDGRYFGFHYFTDEDLEGSRYVLYNDCK